MTRKAYRQTELKKVEQCQVLHLKKDILNEWPNFPLYKNVMFDLLINKPKMNFKTLQKIVNIVFDFTYTYLWDRERARATKH